MKPIPMLDLRAEYLYMKAAIDAAFEKCLEHQQWILGPEVKALEGKVADYLGVKHCIGVASGTDALLLSLRALALARKGQEYFDRTDEIITTPFTFTATGGAILRSGATPVFADIEESSFGLSAPAVRAYLESADSRNVVGIVPVHLYGHACDMDPIMEVADRRGLFVLEDVAQAFGGKYRGRKLGSIGTAGAFSFFPSKNLGGFGDGGMVASNDDVVADFVRMLAKHGGRDKYNSDHIGYNSRLDSVQAGVLLAKLDYVDEFNERRRRLADAYSSGLADLPNLVVPRAAPEVYHVYHQYTIRILDGRRDGLQSHLKATGIASMVYYPVPLHRMNVFRGRQKTAGCLARTEAMVREVLSLPIEPLQSEEVTRTITRTIRDFLA